MIKWRYTDEEPRIGDEDMTLEERQEKRCTIFLGYTSNMVTSGVREVIRFLCQHKMVDAIVTTTGAIEEDIMKTFEDVYIGDF
jgi:deoxyhypusine synthase